MYKFKNILQEKGQESWRRYVFKEKHIKQLDRNAEMKVLVILTVLCLSVGYGNSCTCVGVPTNGCDSDYSILGTVIGVQPLGTPPNDERIYTVLVQRIYKTDRPLSFILQIRAYVEGSLCGLLLTPGRQYVISGYYRNSMMWTNACLYTRLFSQIPLNEKLNLDCYNRPRY
uniref:NTR domain-containing protein n=1 Tax=Magallana gigas TaxID=29159 RepID=A0A8W8LMA7_MAGGI|nr:NTR domain-containing protein-like [Crassostrea gigas]XP_034305582.1 NTR domain-containing protein-like [Crassostrea gigas]XP_034305583.1 NTR domain-containing protein-like [Crassostrea gigas]XP_034305584.1 NTR domain-containing protein-like [Crassostrea gigas]